MESLSRYPNVIIKPRPNFPFLVPLVLTLPIYSVHRAFCAAL